MESAGEALRVLDGCVGAGVGVGVGVAALELGRMVNGNLRFGTLSKVKLSDKYYLGSVRV